MHLRDAAASAVGARAQAGGVGPQGPEGPDWSRTRRAVLRFRWLGLAIVVGAAAAGFIATRIITPMYAAEVMVWIDQDGRQGDDPIAGMRPNQSFDAAAWVDLVRSYQVLDTVVRTLRLNVEFEPRTSPAVTSALTASADVHPGDYRLMIDGDAQRWTLLDKEGVQLDAGAIGQPIGARLGFQWVIAPGSAAPGGTVRFSAYTPRDAARRLGEALDVHINPVGNFMRVGLSGPNPARVAAILNAIATRYVAVAADLQRLKLDEVTHILGARADEAQQNLRKAEHAFETFRVRAITEPSDATSTPTAAGNAGSGVANPAITSYETLRRDREELARTRQVLQRVVDAHGSDQSIAQLDGIAAVERDADLSAALKDLAAKRADLRTLVYRYSDVYPPVQRLQNEIEALKQTTIPGLAGRLDAALRQRDSDMSHEVAQAATTLRAMPPRAVEENRLRRDVDLAASLYTTLQQRYDAARVAAESRVADVRILDAAVAPDRPDSNGAIRIMLIALCGGIGLAFGTAVLLDRADPKVRYMQQVSGEMGLAVLGALPHLARRPRWLGGRLSGDAAMVEALRSIRMSVEYAHGAGSPLLLTVTSPGASDGKSFLSANLARSFAESGRRTILIDGDIRRGAQHRKFATNRRPGLTDFLLGDAAVDDIIRQTGIDRLSLVTSGTRTRSGPDLLGPTAMTQLIAVVRPRYDVIICDSPPLGAGIDACVLGVATGALLMVLRPGVSHREMANAKLDEIDRMPIRLLGAVLNDVHERDGIGYYQAYYLPGYGAADEREPNEAVSTILT